MVVRSSGLSSEFRIRMFSHISPQALACSSRFSHSSHEHLLHKECAAVRYGLLLFFWSRVHLVTVSVEYVCHEHRFVHHSVVSHCAVCVHEFKQVYVACSECQRWSVVELALYAHCLSRLDDVLDAHLLPETHGHRVDATCKGSFQRHGIAGEVTIGVRRSPSGHLAFLCIVNLHREIFVPAFVART